jgi:drug/metabolite transporter (DMT)-like permease
MAAPDEKTTLVGETETEAEEKAKAKKEFIGAALSICLLVSVACSKTLLTKQLFSSVSTPVAFSALSAIATCICLVPVFLIFPKQWAGLMLQKEILMGFGVVCVFVATDMGCTNTAVLLLSVALQQCILATSPFWTVIIESIVKKKSQHPLIYMTISLLVAGAIFTNLGSQASETNPLGIMMMMIAVLASSTKNVFIKKTLDETKKHYSSLAFLFWLDCFILLVLVPWSVINGEASILLFQPRPLGEWVQLTATAAFGGVRALSQFMVLAYASATTLPTASLTTQTLTILLSIPIFHTQLTVYMVIGVSITLSASALYTYFKISKVLEGGDKKKEKPAESPA